MLSPTRAVIDGEVWVPWHLFLAVDLVPGRCEEGQAARRATRGVAWPSSS
jgi:hypothetical protein